MSYATTPKQVSLAFMASGAELRPRSSSWTLRLVDRLFPAMASFWTTTRLPFCRPVIFHPSNVTEPLRCWQTVWHELGHVDRFAPWYGPAREALLYTLAPLPILLSGRWFVERHQYLRDIANGFMTIDQAVDILWRYYLWPWPRSWMREWFKARVTW